MRRAYTLILNHTALVLAILSLLMIAEMGLAMWNIVPIGYEWLLRWILILTILIWTGMAGRVRLVWDWDSWPFLLGLSLAPACIVFVIISTLLIPIPVPTIFLILAVLTAMVISALTGLIIPADYSVGKLYWIFVIAPLVFLALIMTYYLNVVFFGSGYWESIVNIYFLLLLGLIGGVLGLLIQLHSESMSSGRYVVIVLRSLGAGAFVVVWILASLVLAAAGSSPLSVLSASVVFMPLSASSSLALLVAWWIGVLPPLCRKIFVSVVGLWVIYMAMGWFWLIAMDNGLRAFTGEERSDAEVALGRKTERYIDVFDPWKRRVVRDADGQFDVVFYTWWGLKARRQ